MDIRFQNARILTMEEPLQLLPGELWVRDGKIEYAGPAKTPDKPFDRTIDAAGDLLMPGFKNAHTHSPMTFLRSLADDLPLDKWLNEQVFPMEAKLTPADIGPLTRLAILEYLTSGITAAFDMYMFPKEVAETCAEAGFRVVLCGSVNDFSSSPEELGRDHETYNHFGPLVSHQLGFHAEYTTSEGRLREIAALSQKFGAPVYTHNAETKSEVEGCLERHGMTPTQYFEKLHLLDFGGGFFHGVYLTPDDIELCAKRHLAVVANPASNAKLASGIAPLTEMLASGVTLGLGTDGPASNNCLDMFREMFLATALQKLRLSDAAALDALDVLRMATVGSAQAMGLSDCARLTPGSEADVVRLSMHAPNMQPENHILKNIVYSGSKLNVRMTMVRGKILYEDGEFFIGADPEEVYAQANAIVAQKRS